MKAKDLKKIVYKKVRFKSKKLKLEKLALIKILRKLIFANKAYNK